MKENRSLKIVLFLSIIFIAGWTILFFIHPNQKREEESPQGIGGYEEVITPTLADIHRAKKPSFLPVEKSDERQITSEFGDRWGIFNSNTLVFHNGIDIATPDLYHSQIYSPGDGIVTDVWIWHPIYGKCVIILCMYEGDIYTILLAHMSITYVREGQRVSAGEVIGRMGNTGKTDGGAHLHYGVMKNGVWINPMTLWDGVHVNEKGYF